MPAQRAEVSRSLPPHSRKHGGIERIALRAVTPLPRAHALPLLSRGLLHEHQDRGKFPVGQHRLFPERALLIFEPAA
jgi:hypothetical protein